MRLQCGRLAGLYPRQQPDILMEARRGSNQLWLDPFDRVRQKMTLASASGAAAYSLLYDHDLCDAQNVARFGSWGHQQLPRARAPGIKLDQQDWHGAYPLPPVLRRRLADAAELSRRNLLRLQA